MPIEIKIKKLPLSKIKPNPDNPRRIKGSQFDSLVKSLTEFPEMLELREIVVDETMTVLGGNMRLKALQKVGAKDCVAKIVTGLTDAQKREFIIKDNGAWGEWEMDQLLQKWGDLPLSDWGVDLPDDFASKGDDETYTKKIVSPTYNPTGEKPKIQDLIDRKKADFLIDEIKSLEIPKDVADFLISAAERHVVFNFRQIAEFYCHADEIIQGLMERSGLVIIDFNKAIEYGFVQLTKKLGEIAEGEDFTNA